MFSAQEIDTVDEKLGAIVRFFHLSVTDFFLSQNEEHIH